MLMGFPCRHIDVDIDLTELVAKCGLECPASRYFVRLNPSTGQGMHLGSPGLTALGRFDHGRPPNGEIGGCLGRNGSPLCRSRPSIPPSKDGGCPCGECPVLVTDGPVLYRIVGFRRERMGGAQRGLELKSVRRPKLKSPNPYEVRRVQRTRFPGTLWVLM